MLAWQETRCRRQRTQGAKNSKGWRQVCFQLRHLSCMCRPLRGQVRSHQSSAYVWMPACFHKAVLSLWEPACWRGRWYIHRRSSACNAAVASKLPPTWFEVVLASKLAPTKRSAARAAPALQSVGTSLLAKAAEQAIHMRRRPRRPRDQGRSHKSVDTPEFADKSAPTPCGQNQFVSARRAWELAC
jgi:hypothetical protein